jgi:hypothetical protein
MPMAIVHKCDGCNVWRKDEYSFETPPPGWISRSECPEIHPSAFLCEVCAESFFKKNPAIRVKVKVRLEAETKRRLKRKLQR